MKEIVLTKGKVAFVDDADFERVNKHKWCMASQGYAKRRLPNSEGGKIQYMHSFILGKHKDNLHIDHIDRNKLNNTRANLRFVTQRMNNQNRVSAGKSKYLGVHQNNAHNRRKSYVAQAKQNGKTKTLGYFYTEEEAALAYNAAVIREYGEGATINIIKSSLKQAS